MDYSLAGTFLEACDCTVICPCWVDDDPVGGHCTGFILWRIDEGTIDGRPVEGCTVVSVSTHGGNRRDTSATTSVLYIDTGQHDDHDGTLVQVLGTAFAGKADGILAELADVTGTVVHTGRATVTLHPEPTDPASDHERTPWQVTVTEHGSHHRNEGGTNGGDQRDNDSEADSDTGDDGNDSDTDSGAGNREQTDRLLRIEATGHPKVFDTEEVEAQVKGGTAQPMTLHHTALSHELQAQGPVIAQQGERLTIRSGALPGGNLDVEGRSGMRGEFRYSHSGPSEAGRTGDRAPTTASGA